jgi:hypothetical protein
MIDRRFWSIERAARFFLVLGFVANLAGVLALHQKSLGSTTYRGSSLPPRRRRACLPTAAPASSSEGQSGSPPPARRPFYLQNNLMESGLRQASMGVVFSNQSPRMLNVVNVAGPYTPSQTREDAPQSAPSPTPRVYHNPRASRASERGCLLALVLCFYGGPENLLS